VTIHLKLVEGPSPESGQPALTIRNISKIFEVAGAPVSILDNICFKALPGELICLLGPSGCGKTTLLNIIAGLTPAAGGTVYVQGHATTRPGSDRCVVFQEDALFPWLTVRENIGFGLKGRLPAAAARNEVDRFINLVGLDGYGDYLPRELSGGMKQRVALARVLILKPHVLLMDEPFGALDAQTREEMQQLLLALWQELSHTILFVTHDINEAVFLADRIILMDKHPGRIRDKIAVTLPRPRAKESDSFHRFYRKLRELA
jgi:NitT/TauT family transport system ATP-binding protein